MSTLRKDPLSHAWVVFLEENFQRSKLPPAGSCSYPAPEHCPFCEHHEGMTPPEIQSVRPAGSEGNAPGWQVRTVPNQFAALRIEGKLERRGEGLYDTMNGVGAHEVVIETPFHNAALPDLPAGHIREILWMYRARMLDLMKDPRFRYIQIFRNHGEFAGANIGHPHSQVVALPIVPRSVREQVQHSFDYWQLKERCIFCDIIAQDANSPRLVFENEDFIALEPFAAKLPFETWIYPKQHSASFHTVDDAALVSLAEMLKAVLKALEQSMGDPPYNLILHSAPLHPEKSYHSDRARVSDHYHWHFEILPHTQKIGGFQYGTGFYLNSVRPEAAAEFLRNTIAEHYESQETSSDAGNHRM